MKTHCTNFKQQLYKRDYSITDNYMKKQHIVNIPSNIKAIPIAVMIVLCPITTTNAGEIMNQVEVAQEKTAYELFGLRCIENAVLDKSMIPERYKAYFDKTGYKDYKYGRDKSDKDYTCITKWIGIRAFNDNQKMFITASTVESDWHHVDDIPDRQTLLRSYNLEINNLKLNTILKRDKNGKYLGCVNHYYVCGPGWKYNVGAFDERNRKEVPVNTNYKEDPNLQIEISKKLFDTIFEAYNKQLPVEKVITNVCYEE